ncbi:MAG TPA: glyoxalase [Cytophagales bacterium]|nr:glyoxalase [Cytophagales bacterium]HAA20327.1 glyoxalase [Cytophagales bacterium]HAP62900.1 glyoxalase [Cytophagales bacterium]
MSTHSEIFSHAATVLAVQSMDRSLTFYRDQLGFTVTFTWQEPITYAVLRRGDVSLHLTLRDDDSRPSSVHTALYIFVYDVRAVYQELENQGVALPQAPEARDYAMEDFDVVDPDGYRISFGESVEAEGT